MKNYKAFKESNSYPNFLADLHKFLANPKNSEQEISLTKKKYLLCERFNENYTFVLIDFDRDDNEALTLSIHAPDIVDQVCAYLQAQGIKINPISKEKTMTSQQINVGVDIKSLRIQKFYKEKQKAYFEEHGKIRLQEYSFVETGQKRGGGFSISDGYWVPALKVIAHESFTTSANFYRLRPPKKDIYLLEHDQHYYVAECISDYITDRLQTRVNVQNGQQVPNREFLGKEIASPAEFEKKIQQIEFYIVGFLTFKDSTMLEVCLNPDNLTKGELLPFFGFVETSEFTGMAAAYVKQLLTNPTEELKKLNNLKLS